MRNISDKSSRESQNTRKVFSNFLFANHSSYEKKWKNIVESDGQLMKIWRMRIACWICKATSTHTQVVLY